MKKVVTFIFLLFFSCNNINQECNTYYLIRHAEKVRIDPDNKDPELNEAGKQRAIVWQEYFTDLEIDKVYSTNYKRTMQTALPVSNSKGLEISLYSPSNIDYEGFLYSTIGDNVLIVGHSNTIPTFVNEIINDNVYPDIEDSNNSSLYIVSKCGDEINHEVIKID
jgi:broad specificity phosphatase PhoE|tara:strand:+ start:852 stop:1346 length:495 start_codon:yes stop_codon:yes gene_type:complete